jgi:anti-anti-sigma factor
MTIQMCEATNDTSLTRLTVAIEPAELHELVKGQDQCLLARVGPLVADHSLTLDLANVERIDAAGITALLALYQCAQNAGNMFSLTNVSSRVAEILTVVGLDQFLIAESAEAEFGRQRPAA